ncbi:MAG: hypothetical protein A4E61_01356 [Syntrophorhabdus sp. PtaB.Bin184]|nr:MAG: hypothetical protein A4E61_01356 [Syntrophorhabdus sp. PtaB.Bin184]
MAFDVEGARADGYSEEEIAAYLEKNEPSSAPKFDITADKFDVQGALNDGYTEQEIADFVTKKYGTAKPVQTAQTTPPVNPLDIGARNERDRKEFYTREEGKKQQAYMAKVVPAVGQALKASPLKFGEGLLQFMNTINQYSPTAGPSYLAGKITESVTGQKTTPPSQLEEWSLDLRNIAKGMEPQYERGTPEYYAYNATLSLAQNIGPIALGTVTGSQWLALMMMGGAVAGEKKNELMEKGYTEDQASVISGMYGAAEVIGEKISIGKLIKGPMLSRIILGTAYDIPGELLTEVLQAGIDKGILKEEDAFNWDRFIDTAIITGLSGPILGAGSGAISKVQQRAAKKDFSRQINAGLESGELTITDPNAQKPATPGQWFAMPKGIAQETQTVEIPVIQSPITFEQKDTGPVALADGQEVGSYTDGTLTISPDYQGDRVGLARKLLEDAIKTFDNERGAVTPYGIDEPLYHGSNVEIDKLQVGIDGGIHVGTKEQAEMRNSKHVYEVTVRIKKAKRERDTGGDWKTKIEKAKKAGYDGIVYLNRYEGIDREQYLKLLDEGWTGEKLDALSDKEFKKLFPSMRDSYIVFSPDQILEQSSIVSSIRNTLNEKGSIDLTPIVDLGRSVYQQGATTFEKFSQRIQELVGNAWDKVKDFVRQAWDVISNERGSITIDEGGKRGQSFEEFEKVIFGDANVGDTFAEDPLAKHMSKAELKAFREKGMLDARVDDLKESISALKDEIRRARTLANDFFRAGRKIGALDQLERVHQMEAMRKQRQAIIREGTKLKNWLKSAEKKYPKMTTIDPEYRAAIQSALDLNADALENFILTQLQAGDVFMLDEGQIDLLRDADVEKPTIEDLRNRVSIVKQLLYQGRKQRQIEIANERFERRELINGINDEIRTAWGIPELSFTEQLKAEYFVTAQKDMPGKIKALGRMMQNVASVLRKAEYIIENLSGYKENSLLKRATFDKIVEAERVEINLSKESSKMVMDAFSLIKDDYAAGKLDSLMTVQGLTMERKKAIAIALNSGNEGNRRALTEGTNGELTSERIDAIVNFLEPNEKAFVRAIWNVLEWQRPHLQKAYRSMTGENMKLVEGQYYPLMFDKRYATRIAQAQEEQNLFRLYGSIASVGRGFTKSRTGGTMAVDLDFMRILEHIDDVNHFVAYGQAVRDVNRVISNNIVKQAVENAIGEPYNKMLKRWLKSIANPQYESLPGWDRIMGRIRNNSATAILGYSLSTTFLQPLAITQTINRLGVTDTLKGFTEFYRDWGALSQFVSESSPFMSMRTNSFDATLKEIMDGDKDKVWNQGKATEKIKQSFFSLIGLTDKMATMPTWYAAYQKEMAKSQDHQKAVDFADEIVRQSQSSGMPKDLAEVQRGNNTRKAFVMFYSYFSTTYNEMARSVDLVKHKKIGYLGLMRSFFWMMMVPAIFQAIVKNRGFYDEDEPEKEIPLEIAKELVGYGAGTIPVLGSAINSFMSNYEYRPAPAMDVVKQSAILAQTTKKLISGDTSYHGKGVHPALRSGSMLAGYAFGLPSRQAMRIADEAWNAYDEGEVSWKNLYGLVYKEQKK